MKLFRKLLRFLFYVLLIPVGYLVVSLVLTAITVPREAKDQPADQVIYLNTNGVHLDIVLPRAAMTADLSKDLKRTDADAYMSFGWGDENFYINTPTWGDLTFANAFRALFLESTTLMHLTRYRNKQDDWVEVRLSVEELEKINTYLVNSFKPDGNGNKEMLKDAGYGSRDDFYKANGSYSCIKTCNTWVNTALKESGLKACLWTPFDFGLMGKYD